MTKRIGYAHRYSAMASDLDAADTGTWYVSVFSGERTETVKQTSKLRAIVFAEKLTDIPYDEHSLYSSDLEKTNKAALKESFRHWWRIWTHAKKQNPLGGFSRIELLYNIDESIGSEHCPLCAIYALGEDKDKCIGCPLDLVGENCNLISSVWARCCHSSAWKEFAVNAREMCKTLLKLRWEMK